MHPTRRAGFDALLKRTRDSFERLLAKPPIPVKDASDIPKCAGGIYVFYENGKPLRVGTSRKLRTRIKQHHGSNPRNAAFAKLLARKATGIGGSYQEGWKKQWDAHRELREAFEKARERIRKMSVRWIEEDDADVRYLLEFYAAKELQTRHNDFSET